MCAVMCDMPEQSAKATDKAGSDRPTGRPNINRAAISLTGLGAYNVYRETSQPSAHFCVLSAQGLKGLNLFLYSILYFLLIKSFHNNSYFCVKLMVLESFLQCR